jgi:predicted DNA-binding transcriptional regulator AlpA
MSKARTVKDLCDLLAVSRATLHRMRSAGEVLDPIKTTRRIVRWSASDVELWQQLGFPNAADFRKLKRTKARFAP